MNRTLSTSRILRPRGGRLLSDFVDDVVEQRQGARRLISGGPAGERKMWGGSVGPKWSAIGVVRRRVLSCISSSTAVLGVMGFLRTG